MRIDKLLLKVASRCNIDCSYCYIYNHGDTNWQKMPKHMSFEIIEHVLTAVSELYNDQQCPFDVVLHGGEPLLLPRHLLHKILEGLANRLPPSCPRSIQTNGILVDEQLLDLCVSTGTTISISLDGPAEVHDRFRIMFDGGGTHERVLAAIARIRHHPEASRLFTGVLAVIEPRSDPRRVYDFFKCLRVPSVDFLFKDGNFAKLPLGKVSVASTEYGKWLAVLWDCYVSDTHPPRIRILDDLARMLLWQRSNCDRDNESTCGMIVIDTDGTLTKNDTLKSTYDGADRFASAWSVRSARLSEIAACPEFLEHAFLQQPTSPICQDCSVRSVCGGGMLLSRWHPETGFNNPSVYCADYKFVIGHMDATLRKYDVSN